MTKARNFCFILYPNHEEVPTNWLELLNDLHIQMAISPVHDRDTDGLTGEIKEEHYHVLLSYPNTTSEKYILKNVVQPVGGTGLQVVRDLKGMYAYLSHKYEISKEKYDPDDIIHLSGFNPVNFGSSPAESISSLKELFEYIQQNHIISFSDLIDKLNKDDNLFLLDAIRKNTYMVKSYVDSKSKDRFKTQHLFAGDTDVGDTDIGRWKNLQVDINSFQNKKQDDIINFPILKADDSSC